MIAHTQGPWFVARSHIPGMISTIITDPQAPLHLAIAHIENVTGFGGDSDANAHLIAAAPELLEALRNMLRGAEQIKTDDNAWVFDYAEARTAIAKAGG